MAMAHNPYTMVTPPATTVQEENNDEDFLEWLYLKTRDDLSQTIVMCDCTVALVPSVRKWALHDAKLHQSPLTFDDWDPSYALKHTL